MSSPSSAPQPHSTGPVAQNRQLKAGETPVFDRALDQLNPRSTGQRSNPSVSRSGPESVRLRPPTQCPLGSTAEPARRGPLRSESERVPGALARGSGTVGTLAMELGQTALELRGLYLQDGGAICGPPRYPTR